MAITAMPVRTDAQQILDYIAERHQAFSADLNVDDLNVYARCRSAGAAAVLADIRHRFDPAYREQLVRDVAAADARVAMGGTR